VDCIVDTARPVRVWSWRLRQLDGSGRRIVAGASRGLPSKPQFRCAHLNEEAMLRGSTMSLQWALVKTARPPLPAPLICGRRALHVNRLQDGFGLIVLEERDDRKAIGIDLVLLLLEAPNIEISVAPDARVHFFVPLHRPFVVIP